MKRVTKETLIADVLDCYQKIDSKWFKNPRTIYTEKQLRRMTRAELQLLLTEMVLS